MYINYSSYSTEYILYIYMWIRISIDTNICMYIFESILTHVNYHLINGYFLWVPELFMCRKWRNIFAIENGERSLMLQKSAENFTAQQKVKKSQFRGRNWKNIPSIVEIEDKPNLQHRPLDFESIFVHKLVVVEWVLGAHFAGVSG